MRSSGILMHISSLPSPYGIGTLGKDAKEFVDFLVKAGQKYWQVLPVCPTSYGDSPYQTFSSYAGNPYFIDLDYLQADELLTKEECSNISWFDVENDVNFGTIYEERFRVLRKAFGRFKEKMPNAFFEFTKENSYWLDDYALFMSLKEENEGKSWLEWEKDYKLRTPHVLEETKVRLGDDILFWKVLQYFFFTQWNHLKEYANQVGVEIIGDVPIYVSADSVDVWGDPSQFLLDESFNPIDVAGCPPDGFTEDGQLWGNPLFRWDVMEKDDFTWWTKRVSYMSKLFDVVRIDHFRGFESYYAIPYGSANAKKGEWRKGPGLKLFEKMEEKLGKLNIIVEDLGFLTPEVKQMVKDSGFPGMKLIQFAFDSREDGDYLPHNYNRHSVVYTGTHDNDTILGWIDSAPKDCVAFAKSYLRLTKEEGYHWGIMKAAWSSVSDLAIVTMQDLLDLGGEARMNMPSTLGRNWKWRCLEGAMSDDLAEKIKENMVLYGRRVSK